MGTCADEHHTPPPIATIHAPGVVEDLAIAGTSRSLLVVAVADGVVRVAAVPQGNVRRTPAPQFVALGTGHVGVDRESEPQVVAVGDGYVAAWRRTRARLDYVVSIRLRGDGSPIGEESAQTIDDARPGLALASSGTGFAIELVTGGAVTVRVSSPDGTPQGEPIILPGSGGARSPALTWMDPAYLAGWVSGETVPATVIVAQVLPARGSAQQLSGLRTTGAAPRPTLAASPSGFMLTLADTGPTEADGPALFATAFQASGERLVDPQLLGARALDAPADVAWDGTHFGVAWTERDAAEGGSHVRWRPVGVGGAPASEAVTVRDADLPAPPLVRTRLAWDGTAYVLARRGATANDVAVHRFGTRGCDAR